MVMKGRDSNVSVELTDLVSYVIVCCLVSWVIELTDEMLCLQALIVGDHTRNTCPRPMSSLVPQPVAQLQRHTRPHRHAQATSHSPHGTSLAVSLVETSGDQCQTVAIISLALATRRQHHLSGRKNSSRSCSMSQICRSTTVHYHSTLTDTSIRRTLAGVT